MDKRVNILFVDDSEDDVFLFLMELRQAKYEVTWRRVETKEGLESALRDGNFQLAVVDYVLPGFSGTDALELVRDRAPYTPAIVVSGKVSEEVIGDAVRAGAYDYVLKDNRRRFVSAVERALACRDNALRAAEAEAEIARLNHELSVKYEIASICLTSPDIDMYPRVMDVLQRELSSEIGMFGYVNYKGDLVCPSVSREVWDRCQMSDKSLVFPESSWGGLWGRALRERQTIIANDGLTAPTGHVPVLRAIAAPLVYDDELVGLLMVGNKEDKYGPRDAALMQAVGEHIAPIISARIAQARTEFERQEMLAALRSSEERYRELFDNMVSGVIAYRLEGNDFVVSSVNRAAESLLHVGAEELVGRVASEAFPGMRDMGLLACIHEVYRTGQPTTLSNARYEDGSSISGWYDNTIYRVSSGEVIAVFDNVTPQVKTRLALEESEERYALAVEGANDAVWDWNLRTDEVYFAPKVKRMLGHDNASFPNSIEAFEHYLARKDRRRVIEALKNFVNSGERQLRLEFRMQHNDGASRWLLMRGASVFGTDGLPVRMAGSLSDITSRKRAEEAREKALKASIERATEMENLLSCAEKILESEAFEPTARHIFDAACSVIGAAGGYVALLNEDRTENDVLFLVTGQEDCTVDPDLPMPLRGLRADAYEMGRAVLHNDFMNSDHVSMLPEGHVTLENVMLAPLNIEGRTVGLMGLANKPGGFGDRDLRMGEAFGELCAVALQNSRLRDRQKEHAATLEATVAARTQELSAALLEAHQGRDRIDAILQSVGDGLMVTDLQGRVELINEAAEHALGLEPGGVVGERLKGVMAEGTLRDKLLGSIRGERTRYEFDLAVGRDGETLVYHANTSVFKTLEGEPAGVITIFRDVTKEREIERMKDEFLSTAAHELRTPLTSIRGFSELLRLRDDLSAEESARFLEHIFNQSGHLASIVNDLLDLSRIESGTGFKLVKEMIRPSALVADLLPPFESASPDHRFSLDVAQDEPEIRADKDKLIQVVRNLLSNAVKYSPDGGAVEAHCGSEDGRYLLRVRDNGVGMTPDQLDRVFDKFFRADSSSTAVEGTGLGMSIVKHIVDAHGGQIDIASSPGAGTIVNVRLPLETGGLE